MSLMPRTDGGLGPGLEWQLRSSLDRVQPPHSAPRYMQETGRVKRGSIAPGLFAAAVTGILVLTLLAAAGARSVDLQHRIVNTIQSGTAPSPSPIAEPSPSPSPAVAQQAPPVAPTSKPKAAASPQPTHEPGDDGSSPRASSSPSPDH